MKRVSLSKPEIVCFHSKKSPGFQLNQLIFYQFPKNFLQQVITVWTIFTFFLSSVFQSRWSFSFAFHEMGLQTPKHVMELAAKFVAIVYRENFGEGINVHQVQTKVVTIIVWILTKNVSEDVWSTTIITIIRVGVPDDALVDALNYTLFYKTCSFIG